MAPHLGKLNLLLDVSGEHLPQSRLWELDRISLNPTSDSFDTAEREHLGFIPGLLNQKIMAKHSLNQLKMI